MSTRPTDTPSSTHSLARIGAALCLAASGYLHAQLYLHGYRSIPGIGTAFLVQASGSLAVALLLVAAGPLILRVAAGALTAGALGGFALSRSVGLFGFVERGLNPAPQALLSVLTEVATLALLTMPWWEAHARTPAPADQSVR